MSWMIEVLNVKHWCNCHTLLGASKATIVNVIHSLTGLCQFTLNMEHNRKLMSLSYHLCITCVSFSEAVLISNSKECLQG